MDIRIEKLNNENINKFIALIQVFENVFEMKSFKMPDKIFLQDLLKKDDFFVFVAIVDNEVVGGLTSYIIHQYYSKRPLVYIYDLAVKNEFQRRGIGKRLIESNNDYCKDIGIETVMVQADEVDNYAIEFYHSTGASAQKFIHFEYQIGTP